MTDYKKYINALRKCAKEHDNDRTFTGHIIVSDLCRDTANLLEELEQEPKSGKWLIDLQTATEDYYVCSECGRRIHLLYPDVIGNYPYCHCGVRMESEE